MLRTPTAREDNRPRPSADLRAPAVRRWLGAVGTALTIALVVAGLSLAGPSSTIGLQAQLKPGQESPAQKFKVADASGRFTGTVKKTSKGYRLYWRLTFAHLSGKATFAHIHRGKPGKHGPAVAFLCRACASGVQGRIYFSPPELKLARQGRLYVNVRTAKNPAGEIRGQITVTAG